MTGPLRPSDTVVDVTPEQQHRFMRGYDEQHHPAPWDEEGLAGSGAIRSTAGDLLKYLQANLHREGFGGALSEALAMAHQPRAPVLPRTRIALARYLNAADGTWSHAGAMRGFTSYAFFHPKSATIAATLCESCSACRSAVCARWSRPDEEELRFEEEATPGVLELGLHRDGVMPLGPPAG